MKDSKDIPDPPRNGAAVTTRNAHNAHNAGSRLDSNALFGTRNEIVIVHHDEEYRLRITRAGKLILTK